ncbi:serine/threonine-protein kinase Pink1, mitochondrial [Bacillus rossius redtenbacheri]|uniref:serine/threonine-protein kinase Pink1, mitochondrial n=1 Tax=Bacillus rossius redtenbacheri TaxID=93214 RepID=UPI002FDDFF15
MFEMSIRALVSRLAQNGQVFVRGFKHFNELLPNNKVVLCKPKLNILHQETRVGRSSYATPTRVSTVQSVASQFQLHARRIFVDNVLRRVTNSLTADLRKRTAKRILFGDSAPFFALVGVSLASGTGILTKDEELEGICWEIREAVAKIQWSTLSATEDETFYEDVPVGLNAFEWGSVIAKGCNAVVYSARKRRESESTMEAAAEAQPAPAREESHGEPSQHPLAIKMMFNYDAESNAGAILRAMYRETVPARVQFVDEEFSSMESRLAGSKVALPPHPNVVKMYCVFTDRVPSLPDSLSLYPHALPARINPEGFGRNMSLFLVMKRYDCSLKQYLHDQGAAPRTAVLLLAQLLEGVLHINMHGVAHRDLKSDNILLDVSEGDDVCPLLTITDFGCSLANKDHGLVMPYHSPDMDRGGNTALMAPEVVCATPGAFKSINYSKADVWAAGAIAYEMFGMMNPFYASRDTGKPQLYNYRYREDELPQVPDSVPPLVASVVMGLLKRNPSQRLSAEMAATILQLHLWGPSSWLRSSGRMPATNEILQWLLCLTTKVLCEGRGLPPGGGGGRRTLPEYQLIATFLSRVSLRSVKQALKWIHLLAL